MNLFNVSDLPAHLYVVIERCIYGLKESSQSIYIGGISGSGKSETLKRIIEYIAYRNTNNKKTQKVVLGAMKLSSEPIEVPIGTSTSNAILFSRTANSNF